MEAGLPAGVINFVPGLPEAIASIALENPHFAESTSQVHEYFQWILGAHCHLRQSRILSTNRWRDGWQRFRCSASERDHRGLETDHPALSNIKAKSAAQSPPIFPVQ